MQVSVRLSPAMGRIAGTPYLQVELPDGTTVTGLLDHLRRSYPDMAPHLQTAVALIDGRMVEPSAPLAHGAQVALLQPMAGGMAAGAAPRLRR